MSNSGSSSLRPAWKGGRGFQPPPTVTSDGPTSRGRSSSIASKDSNKFSALGDDDDDFISVSGKKSRDRDRHNNSNNHSNDAPKVNSRGEAFRSSYGGGGGGRNKGGRSLADLASKAPEGIPRSASTGYAPEERGAPRGRRYSTGDPTTDDVKPQRSSEPSAYKQAVEAANVIRYTREKLLALRPRPAMDLGSPPPHLKHVEAPALFSELPQDPVCWDTFDSDAIWAQVPSRRPSAPIKPGEVPGERRRSYNSTGGGRWQRGQALPPSEERRKDKDASNPDDLWDDPIGGATGAAMDFSAFGDEGGGGGGGGGDAFDFDKMAEASRKLEEELHGPDDIDDSGGDNNDPNGALELKVDAKRPLATVGTQIRSGSGDNVNVFEDFDDPAANGTEEEIKQPALEPASTGGEDPSASSRLMAMIGVKKEGEPGGPGWNGSAPADDAGLLAGLSLNPWGDPIISGGSGAAPAPQQQNVGLGLDLASRLESFAAQQKEAEQKEGLRRRQEQEEAQRRAMAQQQAQQDRARQQQSQQQGMQQQQQQQPSPQSQVEAVLMERISTILENSWGRSDLGSILSTLHSEDSRVIPLLGSVELLRDLIAHNPRRVALRQDPAFGAEMAVLQMTNAQWSQHEAQVRAQQEQEDRRRREEQIRMENIQRQRSMSSDGGGGPPRINPDAPWFYSDPQGNIQGPFRGDEMRQWLEAGYFKGDLPISQQAGGPFIALSSIFQDLNVAFKAQPNDNRAQEEAEARARAEDEQRMIEQRRKAEEAEREREQLERQRQAQASEQARQQREAAAAAQREQQERSAAAEASNGPNQPSAQLKMMLGVPQQAAAESEPEPPAESPEVRSSKSGAKNSNNQPPPQAEAPPAKPAAPAWGGAAAAAPPSTRKSMSEIQKEEARRAASVAAQQGGQGRPSSGWANVAATSGGAWAAGAVKPTAAAVVGGGPALTTRNSGGGQATARPKASAPARKAGGGQPQQVSASGSNTADEFGASMSPALEKWCKDQMKKINGTDDLTLVSFCMTLEDASEIRQYLTTYLGSNAQVNKFATEFINKKGGAPPKVDEWETLGSTKKGRKKKGAR